jgi:hypothetical protein
VSVSAPLSLAAACVRHSGLVGLEDNPFDWRVTRDGQVLVSRGGRVVTTLRGAAAERLIGKLHGADEDEAQHLLARATGNYKRGNERHA